MKRQTPPLETIEAFIVATRAPSFRAAADRLALSPSAFTRRIQTLESFIGISLFQRERGVMKLTRAGEQYLRDVGPAIDAIRRATADLRSDAVGSPLRVVASQSLAAGWLVGRLPDFINGPDGAPVELTIGHDARALRSGRADIAILGVRADDSDPDSEWLMDLDAVPVAATRLADGSEPPRNLDELATHTRLGVYRPVGVWETWLTQVGYDGPPLREPKRYGSLLLAYEAAAAGLGVMLAWPLTADRYLEEGRLVPCFDMRASIGTCYRLRFADAAVRRRRDAQAFRSWLKAEIARCTAR